MSGYGPHGNTESAPAERPIPEAYRLGLVAWSAVNLALCILLPSDEPHDFLFASSMAGGLLAANEWGASTPDSLREIPPFLAMALNVIVMVVLYLRASGTV